MTSRFTSDLLSGYLDGELSPDERTVVVRALVSSAELQQELEELQQISAWLRELPGEPAPEELSASVMQTIAGDVRPTAARQVFQHPGRLGRYSQWWTAACSIAALLLMLVLTERSGRPIADGPIAATPAGSLDAGLESVRPGITGETFEAEMVAGIPADDFRSAERRDRSAPRGAGFGGGAGGSLGAMAEFDAALAAPKPDVSAGESLGNGRADMPIADGAGLADEQRLTFAGDLAREEVGRVVSSLKAEDEQIAVVTLSVADQTRSLHTLQNELLRNGVALPSTVDVSSAAVEEFKSQNANRTLAVYVEATAEQVVSTLHGLRGDRRFQTGQPAAPVALTDLDQLSRAQLAWGMSPPTADYETTLRSLLRRNKSLESLELREAPPAPSERDGDRAESTFARKTETEPAEESAADRRTPRSEADAKSNRSAPATEQQRFSQRSAVAATLAQRSRQVLLFPAREALVGKSAADKSPAIPAVDDQVPDFADRVAPSQSGERPEPAQTGETLMRVLFVLESPTQPAGEAPAEAPKP